MIINPPIFLHSVRFLRYFERILRKTQANLLDLHNQSEYSNRFQPHIATICNQKTVSAKETVLCMCENRDCPRHPLLLALVAKIKIICALKKSRSARKRHCILRSSRTNNVYWTVLTNDIHTATSYLIKKLYPRPAVLSTFILLDNNYGYNGLTQNFYSVGYSLLQRLSSILASIKTPSITKNFFILSSFIFYYYFISIVQFLLIDGLTAIKYKVFGSIEYVFIIPFA